jgi:hypothetical protein
MTTCDDDDDDDEEEDAGVGGDDMTVLVSAVAWGERHGCVKKTRRE